LHNLRVCSENCTEDYLAVYDGVTSSSPLIGRFCGRHGAHLISSGTSLLVVFHSGPHNATSFNHSGFSLHLVDRWKSKKPVIVQSFNGGTSRSLRAIGSIPLFLILKPDPNTNTNLNQSTY